MAIWPSTNRRQHKQHISSPSVIRRMLFTLPPLRASNVTMVLGKTLPLRLPHGHAMHPSCENRVFPPLDARQPMRNQRVRRRPGHTLRKNRKTFQLANRNIRLANRKCTANLQTTPLKRNMGDLHESCSAVRSTMQTPNLLPRNCPSRSDGQLQTQQIE